MISYLEIGSHLAKIRRMPSRANILVCFLGLFIGFPSVAETKGKSVPDDFVVILESAPNHLDSPLDVERITITADGTAILGARRGPEGPLPEQGFLLKKEHIAAIYEAVEKWDFFGLKPEYKDPKVADGDYAKITITAAGRTHEVRTVNVRVRDFDRIAWRINTQLPADKHVLYNVFYGADYMELAR